jgi:putative hemolysin
MRNENIRLQTRLRYRVSTRPHDECDRGASRGMQRTTDRLTIVAALLGVVEGVALLAIVFARRGLLRLLAHLLLAVALEVDLIHGLGLGCASVTPWTGSASVRGVSG